ncbi:unnamed protein product [Spirodela intermedia]|uniref:Uncharacterized protein n=1 Tax=Spirodela intermedia TaxID=51605 RepID=A0A7I8ICE3_SPIIN|nr:unnamed protein product [Spirodela intermedia]CAA6655309.1 unnamed protein product [Spirodela intermedia]
MQSAQTSPSARFLCTSQTQLLHLNPAPKLIMSTLSFFFNFLFASMVIRDGSRSLFSSPSPFPTASMTAAPPGWMQKCSTSVLKLIRAGLSLGAPLGEPLSRCHWLKAM